MPGARSALTILQQQFRIVIITARRPSARPQTLDWLHDHGLLFDELYLTDEKTGVADNLVFAVDDHPEHVQDYAKQGVKVFIMDQPWNQCFSASGVTRVTNWKQLLSNIQ